MTAERPDGKILKTMNIIVRYLLCLLALISSVQAQSPNLRGSTIKLDVADFQLRSEKGAASGYVPLNGSSIVAPGYLFPGFAGAPDGTIWVKSGGNMTVLSGVGYASSLWTAGNVSIGTLTTGIYGVKVASGSGGLFLRGGSGNRVVIDYGNTIGGSDSGHTNLLWYIGGGGGFQLAGGQINGTLDLNTHGLTGVTTLAGSASTLNLATSTYSAPTGNFTFTLTGANTGVVVPSTASATRSTLALNATSASLLYGRLGTPNIWGGVNDFLVAPVVPNGSFSIAKTTGLQAALDAKDAILTFTAPLSRATNTISIPRATSVANGYLHAADFATFSSAANPTGYSNGEFQIGNTSLNGGSGGLAKGHITAGSGVIVTNTASGITVAATTSNIPSVKTSSTVFSNSAAADTFHSYTVPASSLGVGRVIRARVFGKITFDAGSQYATVAFKIGATTVVSTQMPASAGALANVPFESEAVMTIQSVGASGTGAGSQNLTTHYAPSVAAGAISSGFSLDTTVNNTITVVITQDTAAAGRSCTVTQAFITID